MLPVHHTPKQHRTKGAVSITTLIIALVVVGVAFVVLKFFVQGAQETKATVMDRNQKVIEQKKVLVNEQAERLKTMRESQETP
jgi:cell shape-determining protein MreC